MVRIAGVAAIRTKSPDDPTFQGFDIPDDRARPTGATQA
jgi:hypothetical protein